MSGPVPTPPDQIQTKAQSLKGGKDEVSVNPTSRDDVEDYRREFLSHFTADDDRRIMRRVDLRFLPLMGFMYLLKQIDFANASSIKVLQVGKPSNILKELHMTADDYNWTQTIYFVGLCLLLLSH